MMSFLSMKLRPLMVIVAAQFAMTATLFAEDAARTARVTRIDGTAFEAGLTSCCAGGAAMFQSASGATTVALDELSSVRFTNSREQSTPSCIVHLADGGRLFGELLGGDAESIRIKTIGDLEWRLPFTSLAGVQLTSDAEFEKSAELFTSSMTARLPGQDVLITRGPEEVKALRGRIESLGDTSGSFVFADKSRTFQYDKAFGVIFAKGAGKPVVLPATLELIDGGAFSGTIVSADATRILVKSSFGMECALETHQVARLVFRSPRVMFLSDLTPIAERSEGRLHRPWSWRRDRSVTNTALSIDGRAFDRGLGMHARTELEYELEPGFESFVATVGIDDSARPSGSVRFRVLGDGRPLFESDVLTGLDAARDIRVEFKGVKKLTLIADFGDDLDLADHANWGGARLIRSGGRH